jgi:hypothetical protein
MKKKTLYKFGKNIVITNFVWALHRKKIVVYCKQKVIKLSLDVELK